MFSTDVEGKGQKTEDRKQKTENRRQKTDDGRQMTDTRIQTIDDKILLHKELSGSLKYEIRNTNPLTHSAMLRAGCEFRQTDAQLVSVALSAFRTGYRGTGLPGSDYQGIRI